MLNWLKKYWPALFLCALFLALLDSMISSLMTCHPPIADTANHPINSEHQQQCTALHGPMLLALQYIIGFVDDHGDVFVAAFTATLAVFTARLWWSTNKLWEATTNASNAQISDTRILERAYLHAEPRGISPFLPPNNSSAGNRIVGHVGFHNVGRLPARNVQWFLNMEHSTSGDRGDFQIGQLEGKGNIIGPGTSMTQGAREIERPTVGDADGYYYVWGKVTYDDGFGKDRHTTFCHRYNMRRWVIDKKRGEARIRPRYGRQHHHGNDAD